MLAMRSGCVKSAFPRTWGPPLGGATHTNQIVRILLPCHTNSFDLVTPAQFAPGNPILFFCSILRFNQIQKETGDDNGGLPQARKKLSAKTNSLSIQKNLMLWRNKDAC